MKMTHVVAVWKEDGCDTYEDTVPANWVKGNCLFWPQKLQVRRAFEKCEEPDGSWNKFQLVKIKFRGEKEVCDDFLDYLKTAAEPETSGIGTFSSSLGNSHHRSSDHYFGIVKEELDNTAITTVDNSHHQSSDHYFGMVKEELDNTAITTGGSMLPMVLSGLGFSMLKKGTSQECDENRKQPNKRKRVSTLDSSDEQEEVMSTGTTTKDNNSQRKDSASFTKKGFPLSSAEFQYRVLKLLAEIKETVKANPNTAFRKDCICFEKFDDVEKFLEFDDELKNNEEKFRELVTFLSEIGGKTAKKNVQNILRRLMSFEVQSCFNLNGTNRKETGKPRQEKKSFTDRKTFEAIVYAVQKSFNEATRTSIREYCGHALKFAPDRTEAGRRSLWSIESVIDTM